MWLHEEGSTPADFERSKGEDLNLGFESYKTRFASIEDSANKNSQKHLFRDVTN